ncbi:MAG: hypothetical protein LUD03_00800, partial [Firmicutes bacterium]|nr:hypothetical protein [Bacillota bacterium]
MNRKFISFAVAAVMVLTCFWQVSFNEPTAEAADKAKIALVPMTVNTSVSSAYYINFSEVTDVSTMNLKAGDTFFVGVKMVDFDNIATMSDGLTAIAAAFEFNTDYLSLITQQNSDTYLNAYTKRFLKQTSGEISYILGYSGDEIVYTTYTFNGSITDYTLGNDEDGADNKVYCSLTYDGTGVAGPYTGTNDDFIGIIGFTVDTVPDADEWLFDFAMEGDVAGGQNSMNTGCSSTTQTKYSMVGSLTRMTEVIDYDVSAFDDLFAEATATPTATPTAT